MNKFNLITNYEAKSIFERALIEAAKQKSNKAIIEKLTIAYDEIKFIVKEILDSNNAESNNKITFDYSNKESNIKNNQLILDPESNIKDKQYVKYILNYNILDKLSRLIERNYFCVKMVVGKIFEKLLDFENFKILSNDINLIIRFANEALNLIEFLKSTTTAYVLERKCLSFLDFLNKSTIFDISSDQYKAIDVILKSLPMKNSSEAFKNFEYTIDKISTLCKEDNLNSKLEGLNLLMETFSLMNSLDEQFEILIEKLPTIIKSVILKPNPEMKEAYFQLGHFLCSMLFNYCFILETDLQDYKLVSHNKNNSNELNRNSLFFIKDELLITQESIFKFNFLNKVKYQLTYQKDILIKCESIVNVCLQVVRTLCVYEKIFDLQYVCFILLKRLYFTFPKYRNLIEDDLVLILVNMCLFTNKYEIENSQESRLFIKYLLQNNNNNTESSNYLYGINNSHNLRYEDNIKNKLQKRIQIKDALIDLNNEKFLNEDIELVEYENLKFKDFNLRIGYPIILDIKAGQSEYRYIEVKDPFSLIYIGFATQAYDINFRIYKYIDCESNLDSNNNANENFDKIGYFKNILDINKIEANDLPVKIVLLAPEPCFYKIEWDNSYSWINNKKLRIRLSVLKPLDQLNYKDLYNYIREPDCYNSKNKLNEIRNINSEKQEVNIQLKEMNNLNNGDTNNKDNNTIKENLTKEFVIYNKSNKILYNINKFVFYNNNQILDNVLYLNVYFLINNKFFYFFVINNINNNFVFVNKFEISEENLYDQVNSYYNKYIKVNLLDSEKNIKHSHINIMFILNKHTSNTEINENIEKELFNLSFDNIKKCFKEKNVFINPILSNKLLNELLLTYIVYDDLTKYNCEVNKIPSYLIIHFTYIDGKFDYPQAAFFQDGCIYDNIKGLDYNLSKSFEENISNIAKYISKTQVLFSQSNVILSELTTDTLKINDNIISILKSQIDLDQNYSIKYLNEKDFSNALGIIPNFN